MNEVQVAASEELQIEAAARRRLERFVRRILQRRELDGWEVSVLLCDDLYIQRLNRRYRKVDGPTDVLSFGQREGAEPVPGATTAGARRTAPAGDVVISLETLRRNARARGLAETEELKRLLIHGILHLEGLDHEEGADANRAPMIAVQEQLLEELKRGTLL